MEQQTALTKLLATFRCKAQTEREKGEYFEQLTLAYLRREPFYHDLYDKVQTYGDWAEEHGRERKDTGIDLVATTTDGEVHAIQCKFYDAEHVMRSGDFGRFFIASGQKPFTHRLIVTTSDKWGEHAEDALKDQQPPVSTIRLAELEKSKIDWENWAPKQEEVALLRKKTPREDQEKAISSVLDGLKQYERGKLLMACGTGKTFTSLKIAEKQAGTGSLVLFLVPSLALLSQTVTEWSQEVTVPMHCYAVCSDSDVGKKRKKRAEDDDSVITTLHELSYPATTDGKKLAEQVQKRHDANHMSVVFATYHSIEAISEAQKQHGLPDFALIVCDEAHRTTGVVFDEDKKKGEESHFVKVHDPSFIKAGKRLYMTATPRIYSDHAKAKADSGEFELCSMDDGKLYGPVLHSISFSQAVALNLLCDYKVIVLAVGEDHIAKTLEKELSDGSGLRVDDAARIVGCWKALAKQGMRGGVLTDEEGIAIEREDAAPMRRAVAFCQIIGTEGGDALLPPAEESAKNKKNAQPHKVSSKRISNLFERVVDAYQKSEIDAGNLEPAATLRCEARHVDGTMNASAKESKLSWLREEPPEGECRILSNVRCLSEGVDVPALDAVLFLTPRNSQIDVVQSVGRVMRKAPGKKYGYVVLPVVIPHGVEAKESLDKSDTWKVVWQVLQALRSHDDRFDAFINRIEFDGIDPSRMEIIAVTGTVTRPKHGSGTGGGKGDTGRGRHTIGGAEGDPRPQQTAFDFQVSDIERAIYAKLVSKVGKRTYWEHWAHDIEKIARTHIARINGILANPANTKEKEAFDKLAKEMRDDLNNSISDEEVVEMLAQHLITQPIFDALFTGYAFTKKNLISIAMQEVIHTLHAHHLETESETLQNFYESITARICDTQTDHGKQEIIRKLYDQFFGKAFPRMTERLGIVYTPVEVVDFIIHSVNDVLQNEFGQTLGSPGVHIIDPFTGTGTFITRLLQSGLITPQQLSHKYRHEIHANEIVLLAYYIAAINIEAVYHSLVGGDYQPFEGICLTDTFQLYEKEDLISEVLADNSDRRKRQKNLDIRVILGNPPYSVGQTNANHNNANVAYPHLDGRIEKTYAARSQAANKNSLYDSYIRAIRWASDRIGDKGVIGFVTNAGWLDANAADGMRKCLAEEFSSLYVFHLRGNQRTQGELSRKEGGKIFGSGSRAPIAISLLVKKPQVAQRGQIYFHDIGDYLSREEKLKKISEFRSIAGITDANGWQTIVPDAHGDWLRQRDDSFQHFIALGDKKGKEATLFSNYSSGLQTNRDAWCYNASREKVQENMRRMIDFYNAEVARFDAAHEGQDKKAREVAVNDFIDTNASKISWSSSLISDLIRSAKGKYLGYKIICSLYRPFSKQWLYYDGMFNHRVYQMPRIFPNASAENRVIMVKQRWNGVGQFALMMDCPPELQTDGGSQCFPEYVYEETGEEIGNGTRTEQNRTEQNRTEQNRTEHYTRIPHLNEEQEQNLVICLSAGAGKAFSALMVNALPDLHLIGDAQCFPMFLYEEAEEQA